MVNNKDMKDFLGKQLKKGDAVVVLESNRLVKGTIVDFKYFENRNESIAYVRIIIGYHVYTESYLSNEIIKV